LVALVGAHARSAAHRRRDACLRAALEQDDPAASAASLTSQVLNAHPDLYFGFLELPRDYEPTEYIRNVRPYLASMERIAAAAADALAPVAAQLEGVVGVPVEADIYVAPSFFKTNGQVRPVGSGQTVLLGVDVQAYANAELMPRQPHTDVHAWIAHELFHAQHYSLNPEIRQAAAALFDPRNPPPVYMNLWIEGLATCASLEVAPQSSTASALMSDRLAEVERPVLRQVAQELFDKRASTAETDRRDYFWLSTGRSDIPARSAYAVGLLVADHVVRSLGLRRASALRGPELERHVSAALGELAVGRGRALAAACRAEGATDAPRGGG
jgi:hypothetical protein